MSFAVVNFIVKAKFNSTKKIKNSYTGEIGI